MPDPRAAPIAAFWPCLWRRLGSHHVHDAGTDVIHVDGARASAGDDQTDGANTSGGHALTTGRLSEVLGMALVGWALDVADEDAEVRRSRLYNRYRLAGGWRWAVRLAEAGIETVCIKGLGTAAGTYPVPELRTMADGDLLVRPADLGRALQFLRGNGFVFGDEPTRSPWGYIGDASAEPLVSPEGVNLDLHQHPDSWPLHRGLPTEAVFAASTACATPEGTIRIPRLEHQILIGASHAARDLFDPPSLKLLVDGGFLLWSRKPDGIDWSEIHHRAHEGDVLRAVRSFLTLMDELALAPVGFPETLRATPGGAPARLLHRIAEDMLSGSLADLTEDMGQGRKLLREVLLAASPRTLARRNLRRMIGLVRPNRGILHDAR